MKFSDMMREGLKNGAFLIGSGEGADDGGVVVSGPGAGLAGDLTASEAAVQQTAGNLLVPLTDTPMDSTKGKKMVPVKPPEGSDPEKFRAAVVGGYRSYLKFGNIQADVITELSGLTPDEVAYFLRSREYAFALACRGIDISNSGHHLTPQQDQVLMLLADTSSRDSLNARLRKAGISNNILLAWRQNPAFDAEYRRITEAITANYENALLELDRKVGEGDQRAIEKKLEISGRYNPQQQNAIDALAIINRTVEILARHLSDQPEVLKAVAHDLATEAQALNAAMQPKQLGR